MYYLNKKQTIICLISGFVFFLFCEGQWNIPIMAWIFSIPLLFISRKSKPVKGLLLISIVIFTAAVIKWPGILGLGIFREQLIAGALSIITVLPFAIDRIFFPMFTENGNIMRKFVGSLIFPAAFSSLEIFANVIPLGGLMSISYSQVENLPLLQITSLFGQFAIVFIMSWFSSVVYFVIDYFINADSKTGKTICIELKRPISVFLVIILSVFTFGGARIILNQPEGDMVKVALAQGPECEQIDGEWINADFETNREMAIHSIDQAAKGGAELVTFNEESFCISYDEETEMKKILSEKAKEYGIYVIAGLELYDPEEKIISENKITCIDPNGEEMYDYTKTLLVPMVEAGYYKPGDGKINQVSMKLGNNDECKVSSVICYEGEFTGYMNKIDADTDINLNPSWEWEGLGDAHSHALILRGVEHGFSVLKATYESEVTASDYFGRCRSYTNPDYAGYDSVSFAYIPTQGVETFYGKFGNTIYIMYPVFLAVLAVLAVFRRREMKK